MGISKLHGGLLGFSIFDFRMCMVGLGGISRVKGEVGRNFAISKER